MFLLTGLKRQCGLFLAQYIEISNAVDLLESARLYGIPRLEHHCTEFMAANIKEVNGKPIVLSIPPSRFPAILGPGKSRAGERDFPAGKRDRQFCNFEANLRYFTS